MFKNPVILLALTLIFAAAADAQKRQPTEDSDVQPERVIERESKSPEPPKEEPRREEPKTEAPRQTETPTPTNSSSSKDGETQTDSRRRRTPDSEESTGSRRRDQDRDGRPRPKPKTPEDLPAMPIEPPPDASTTPNPVGSQPPTASPNQNPSPVGGARGRGGDKDRDEDKKGRRRRGYGGYSTASVYAPTSSPAPPRPFSANDYFDADDVFFNVYNVFVETDRLKFMPFFEDAPGEDFQPLYYTYGREFFANEFRFVSADWAVYYEPDLGDVFINLHKFKQIKFERMVWYPVGSTIKKANKKFGYKGLARRPILVEKIPEIGADKLYSCIVKDLPKGEYEMRLIARDGSTVKHFIRLK